MDVRLLRPHHHHPHNPLDLSEPLLANILSFLDIPSRHCAFVLLPRRRRDSLFKTQSNVSLAICPEYALVLSLSSSSSSSAISTTILPTSSASLSSSASSTAWMSSLFLQPLLAPSLYHVSFLPLLTLFRIGNELRSAEIHDFWLQQLLSDPDCFSSMPSSDLLMLACCNCRYPPVYYARFITWVFKKARAVTQEAMKSLVSHALAIDNDVLYAECVHRGHNADDDQHIPQGIRCEKVRYASMKSKPNYDGHLEEWTRLILDTRRADLLSLVPREYITEHARASAVLRSTFVPESSSKVWESFCDIENVPRDQLRSLLAQLGPGGGIEAVTRVCDWYGHYDVMRYLRRTGMLPKRYAPVNMLS